MPRLVAQSPEFAGRTFDLKGPELTVGRLEDNNIQVEHASISGHHGVFHLEGLDYVVEDLGSTNGTRINGEKVTKQKLRRNDNLRLGNIEMLYDSEHAPPGQPMPELSAHVNLAECATHGRPIEFVNASPVGKKIRGKQPLGWTIALALLSVLAVAALGYFFWSIFFNAPVVT